MSLKKVSKNAFIIVKSLLVSFIWVLLSVIGEVFIIRIGRAHQLSENSWPILVGTLFLESVTILLMLFFYRKHSQIIKFPKKNWLQQYLLGFFLGLLLFTIIWLVCVLLHGFTVKLVFHPRHIFWLFLFLGGYMFQGMCEELICRGYLMGKILELKLPVTAVITNSILFMILHGLNNGFNLLAAADLLFFGLFMSLISLNSRSLWIVGAFHASWNFAEGVIFGTSVSGTANTAIILQSKATAHHFWLNGGTFGIEGSLVGTIIDGLFLVFVCWYFYHHKFINLKKDTNDQIDY